MTRTRAAILCLAAVSSGASAATPAKRVVLPADVVPTHYDLSLTPDAKDLTFTATVAIEIEVAKTTPAITLNAAELHLDHVRIDGETQDAQIAADEKQETARFTFAHPVTAGHHRLAVEYHGTIFQQPSGLFALDYDTPQGKARALFTQFEASDARRMFPSFDEPGRKATFTLSAVVPANQMALSNMPIAETTPMEDGLQRVTFAQSPKMSSYLLFFGLGDFERDSRMVDGIEVGVVFKRGDRERAAFALDTEAQILPYYIDYFGARYPLPKLDLIAGPGGSQTFGAMENWGAIFSFEQELLIDPKIATEQDRQRVYLVTAHEMAHQWFGDLVTMNWWDDLWLNEGFASWMQNKAITHFHPEWNIWLQELNDKNRAMQTDARAGTHPVVTPILDVLQANNAFDEITYQKGSAVIRMLEAYVGEDQWRAGIRRYIAAHAFGNAETDELWHQIDAESPRKITKMAHDFTKQAGVPQVDVASGSKSYQLSLSRFGLDQANRAPEDWPVPVQAGRPGAAPSQMLLAAGKPQSTGEAGQPLVVNFGQTAYFRTHYDAASFAKLLPLIGTLSPDDQLGLLNDSLALSEADLAPVTNFLDIATRLPADADPVVWTTLVGGLLHLDRLYDGLPSQAKFRGLEQSLLRPVVARLGWAPKPNDPVNTAEERSSALIALGRTGDAATVAEARNRFARLVAGETLEASVRETVLVIVADNADPAIWDQLHSLAKSAPTALEKAQYYRLLGNAKDPALADKALALSLSGEMETTTAPAIIRRVSAAYPAKALGYAVEHWSAIEPMLETMARTRYVPTLAQPSSDLEILKALSDFAKAHIPASGDSALRKVEAEIRGNAETRRRALPEIDRWLENTKIGM